MPLKRFRFLFVFVLVLASSVAWPLAAEAQRRGRPRGPVVHQVVWIGGIAYPRYVYFNPWFQYPWGPYPPYGYGYGVRDEFISSLRLEITPKQAEVFVDGYSAGTVDDFDGIFQRLRVRPGGHEVVIYLSGYRTLRHNIYIGPGADQKIRDTMEALAPGETSDLPGPPSEPDEAMDTAPAPPRERPGPRVPAPPVERPQARFGTLFLRVQPADAEILIDGERWSTSGDESRVSIRLPEGRHRIEVRKAGLTTYVEEILIRPGATLTLNVRL